MNLSELLGVEEGVIFKLIGLKGHLPEELYMILDNQLFSMNNLSETTVLGDIFTQEFNPSVLIAIPLDGNLNEDEVSVNEIGFKPNSKISENECEDKCVDGYTCEQPRIDFKEYDYAIEYLRLLHKYTDFRYITRDKKDGHVYVHTYMPYLELENTPDEFWDSIARVKEIIPKELFSFLETTHYYEIEQLLT